MFIVSRIGNRSRSTGRISIGIASTGAGCPERSISNANTADGLPPVEDIPDFCCQHDLGQGLLKQRDAGIQPALVHDGIARISRHEKYPEVRLAVVQLVGQLTAVDPGITMSVSSRSIRNGSESNCASAVAPSGASRT